MDKRIKTVRNDLGLTQKQFAESLNVSKSTVEAIEYGRQTPTARVINDICRIYHVNQEWLISGKGEKYMPLSQTEQIISFMNDIIESDSSDFKKRIITALSKLDAKDWEELEKIASKITNKKEEA